MTGRSLLFLFHSHNQAVYSPYGYILHLPAFPAQNTAYHTGMQDDTLYNMTDNTEYQANLFAADLLINDEEIEDMVQNEDLDYFGLCSSLNATPELMSFKLYSLTKRGQAYHMPMEIQSNFLAK